MIVIIITTIILAMTMTMTNVCVWEWKYMSYRRVESVHNHTETIAHKQHICSGCIRGYRTRIIIGC